MQRWRTAKHNAIIKRYFSGQEHIIKHAFTVAGVDYYMFDDTFNLPYERGLMAIAIYEETRMGCSREYLLQHAEAVEKLLRQNPIDVFLINTLNDQMKDRLSMAFNVELAYKLASVVYFDKTENPCTYEADHNQRKIDFWKKHRKVDDFFLQKPISELMPFLKSAEVDLATYSEVQAKIDQVHSERFQAIGSKS